MAQTLSFQVQVDQSQLPSIIGQMQSGINNQLQMGAMQLGNMASGLAATMSGMSSMGVNPSAMGFAHAVAPGQVAYSLGRQPFIDRTASIVDFMNSASGAVKMRASSIVSAMDPTKIAPVVSDDSRWGGVGKEMGRQAFSIGGMIGGGYLGAKLGAPLGIGGGIGGMFLGMAGYTLGQLGGETMSNAIGLGRKQMDAGALEKMTIERRGYADIAGTFMALGPQKYLPKLGQELDTKANVAFGESVAKAFVARQDYSIVSRGLGKNASYLADVMSSLSVTDRAGYQQYIAPLHRYAGSSAGAVPESLMKPAANYMIRSELLAQAAGFSSVSSKEYQQASAAMQYGGFMMPKQTGPNIYQAMGSAMGTQMRIGKQFGSDFMNSVKDRIRRDLGMSGEQRGWLGGTMGIAQQYGGSVLSEISTFGSGTSVAYAAQYAATQAGGKLGGNVYDMTAQAAGVFSDPGKYVQFRLNYKNIVASGGATDAMYRKNMIMQAKELVRQSPGTYSNEHDALRIMFEGQGMNSEQAQAQASIILGVGKTLVTSGVGGKTTLWDKLTPAMRTQMAKQMVSLKVATSDSDAESKMKMNIYSASAIPTGLELGGDDVKRAMFKQYIDSGRKLNKAWGSKQEALLKRSVSDTDGFAGLSAEAQSSALLVGMSGKLFSSVDDFGVRSSSHLNTLMKLKGLDPKQYQDLATAAKEYQDGIGESRSAAADRAAGIIASANIKGISDNPDALRDILNTRFSSQDALKRLEKERKNLYFGKDGKGEAGEYDMEAVEANVMQGMDMMQKGMRELFNKAKKGK